MANNQSGYGSNGSQVKIDVSQGEAISVSSDSFDPGYDLNPVLSQGYAKKKDMICGYIESGKAIGE